MRAKSACGGPNSTLRASLPRWIERILPLDRRINGAPDDGATAITSAILRRSAHLSKSNVHTAGEVRMRRFAPVSPSLRALAAGLAVLAVADLAQSQSNLGAWTQKAGMPGVRGEVAAATIDGKLFALGGGVAG